MASHFPPLSQFPQAKVHPRAHELSKITESIYCEVTKELGISDSYDPYKCSAVGPAMAMFWPNGSFEVLVCTARFWILGFIVDDIVENPALGHEYKKRVVSAMLKRLNRSNMQPDEDEAGPYEIVFGNAYRELEALACPKDYARYVQSMKDMGKANLAYSFTTCEEFLEFRLHDSGANFCFILGQVALGLHLSDEELSHPLFVKCQSMMGEILFLWNDIASYQKEKLSNTHNRNFLSVLVKFNKVPDHDAAVAYAFDDMHKREALWIDAAEAVLADPVLGNSADVRQWIMELPYMHAGNLWFHQHSRRYNFPGYAVPRVPIHVEGIGRIEVCDPSSY